MYLRKPLVLVAIAATFFGLTGCDTTSLTETGQTSKVTTSASDSQNRKYLSSTYYVEDIRKTTLKTADSDSVEIALLQKNQSKPSVLSRRKTTRSVSNGVFVTADIFSPDNGSTVIGSFDVKGGFHIVGNLEDKEGNFYTWDNRFYEVLRNAKVKRKSDGNVKNLYDKQKTFEFYINDGDPISFSKTVNPPFSKPGSYKVTAETELFDCVLEPPFPGAEYDVKYCYPISYAKDSTNFNVDLLEGPVEARIKGPISLKHYESGEYRVAAPHGNEITSYNWTIYECQQSSNCVERGYNPDSPKINLTMLAEWERLKAEVRVTLNSGATQTDKITIYNDGPPR